MQTEENKRVDTRLKILEKGAEIIHLKGYNHTGIQEILNAAGIPKGSFYNYFKSKEDFGLQVIDFFTDLFPGMIADILQSESLTPVEKLDNILARFITVFRERDFCYGCPIGNLSQEMGDLSQAFRAKLKKAFDKMAEIYTGLIQKAQSQGDISGDIDAQKAAYFIVTSWHGALGHMKILKSTEPLENHRAMIMENVLRAALNK